MLNGGNARVVSYDDKSKTASILVSSISWEPHKDQGFELSRLTSGLEEKTERVSPPWQELIQEGTNWIKTPLKDGLLHLLVKYPNDLYHNGLNLTLVSKTDNAKEEPLNIKLKLTSGQELDVLSHDNVINIYSGEREEVSVQYDYIPLEEISEILVNGTVILVT